MTWVESVLPWAALFSAGVIVGWIAAGSIVRLRCDRERTAEQAEYRIREQKWRSHLERQEAVWEEKRRVFDEARARLGDSFQALSAEALKSNQESFLRLARSVLERQFDRQTHEIEKRHHVFGEMMEPLRDSLQQVDRRIGELETARAGAYAELREQVTAMSEAQNRLRFETGNLVKALRRPAGRGQWGEMHLKRVVELAGMAEHCDFATQVSRENEEGAIQRPDLVIRLPGERVVVVDAKAPMDAYLDALDAAGRGGEEVARKHLARHAGAVRNHIRQLSSKRYERLFERSPEFVVLFLPSESFFSDALAIDPALIEAGASDAVVLATPTTLIALLRAVACGWREEQLAKNSREICRLGREMANRIASMAGHFDKLGRGLATSVDAYNRTLRTMESRVLPTARKFRELQSLPGEEDLSSPKPVEALARSPVAIDSDEKPGDDRSRSRPFGDLGEDPPLAR